LAASIVLLLSHGRKRNKTGACGCAALTAVMEKPMKKTLLLVATLALFSAPVLAQSGQMGGSMGGGMSSGKSEMIAPMHSKMKSKRMHSSNMMHSKKMAHSKKMMQSKKMMNSDKMHSTKMHSTKMMRSNSSM
jgi:hypothetical protein